MDLTLPEKRLQEAVRLQGQGQQARAKQICEEVLAQYPRHAVALHVLAIIEAQHGDPNRGLKLVNDAIAQAPSDANFLNTRGIMLQRLQRFEEAVASFTQANDLVGGHPQLQFNRGVSLHALGRFDEAVHAYDKALSGEPKNPQIHNNRGNALQAMGRFEDAIAAYDRALVALPNFPVALGNRGAALQALGRMTEALELFERVIALEPNNLHALHNRASALAELGRPAEALVGLEDALKINPQFKEAILKRADVLQDLNRPDEAMNGYRALLSLPTAPGEESSLRDRAAVELVWCQRKTCSWSDLETTQAAARRAMQTGSPVSSPWLSLLFDDPEMQHQYAQRYWRELRRNAMSLAKPRAAHDRIRVGYLSGDIGEHATSFLLAGVIEAHDRSAFETICYSYGPDDHGAMRARLSKAFERFVDGRAMTDAELAQRIADDGVDILVDLKGYTRGQRSGILAHRPAPLCVQYLGYPGTMGSPAVDYIIADPFLIPSQNERYFSEAVVRLPDSYQANDDKRAIAATPTRAAVGLPEDAFVFCAFNRPYKITPQALDVWARILRAVPKGLIWLISENASAEANLRRELSARGVDAQRLMFSPQAPQAEHLARHRLADLFLDTWPVCAHTTASDALWAGLPMITLPGSSFISRVGGSVLTAIGLPELIAADAAAYEAMAIGFAQKPDELKRVREKLMAQRSTGPLFDTKRFCREIETAYKTMWDRHQRRETPKGFNVAAST